MAAVAVAVEENGGGKGRSGGPSRKKAVKGLPIMIALLLPLCCDGEDCLEDDGWCGVEGDGGNR